MKDYIHSIGEKVLGGEKINFTEAKKLLNTPQADIVYLIAIANNIRHHFFGDTRRALHNNQCKVRSLF